MKRQHLRRPPLMQPSAFRLPPFSWIRCALCLLCLLCLVGLTGDAQQTVRVTATAYTRTGHLTASGVRPALGMLALSRDLERALGVTFHDKVILEGYGTFLFEDRMHPRWRQRCDVFLGTRQAALRFGIRRGVLLRVLP